MRVAYHDERLVSLALPPLPLRISEPKLRAWGEHCVTLASDGSSGRLPRESINVTASAPTPSELSNHTVTLARYYVWTVGAPVLGRPSTSFNRMASFSSGLSFEATLEREQKYVPPFPD